MTQHRSADFSPEIFILHNSFLGLHNKMEVIKNVALLGADGTLGPAVLHALLNSGFNVTVSVGISLCLPISFRRRSRLLVHCVP